MDLPIETSAETLLCELIKLIGQDHLNTKLPVWVRACGDQRRMARLMGVTVDPTDNGLVLDIGEIDFEYYNT